MKWILTVALMGVSVAQAFAEPQSIGLPVRVEAGGDVVTLPNGVSFVSTFDVNGRPSYYGQPDVEGAILFAKFTGRHVREMITVYVCGKAVTEARVQMEISSGTVMVIGEDGYAIASTFLESGCP
jgi:preprotein translocase subunit SecD